MISRSSTQWSVSSSPLFYSTCCSTTTLATAVSKHRAAATTLVQKDGGGGPNAGGKRMAGERYIQGWHPGPTVNTENSDSNSAAGPLPIFPRTDHLTITCSHL